LKEKYIVDNPFNPFNPRNWWKNNSRPTSRPREFTAVASKPEQSKPKYSPGSIIVSNEKLCPKAQRFIELAKKKDEREQKHLKEFEARLEEFQKQAGALNKICWDIKKEAEDHYKYETPPPYTPTNNEGHNLALQQENKEWMRNESLAWMAKYIIEQTDPYSFANSEEFKELRNAMLTVEDQNKANWLGENANRIFKALGGYSMKEDAQAIQDLSEAHLIIDNAHTGRGPVNSVYMDVKEIRSIVHTKGGSDFIEFRQDIVDITVTDEHGKENPWMKRFRSGEYIISNGGRIKIEIPGNKCNGKERTKCIIHFYNAEGKEIDNQEIPTEELRKINIKLHGKDQGNIEHSIDLELKTMPDGNISLEQKYPYEKAKNAFRINLNTRMLIMQDGQFAIPIDMLDFTETKIDKEIGTIFYTDKEHRPIAIEILGSLGTHFKSMQGLRSTARNQAYSMRKSILELLNAARHTNNPQEIFNAFAVLDTARADWTTNNAEIVKELQNVPKNAETLALMKGEQQNFGLNQRDARDASMQSNVHENCESVKKLIKACNAEAGSFIEEVINEVIKPLQERSEKKDLNSYKTSLMRKLIKKGAFELDNIYTIKLSKDKVLKDLDMLDIAQKYEEHIYPIKDLPENYKEHVENFINAGENAINEGANEEERNGIIKHRKDYITNFIKNANMKIKDLSAEDQALIIEHAEKYTKMENAINISGVATEAKKNILREHARNYMDEMKGFDSGHLGFLQMHAKDYVNAENNEIGKLPSADQELVRKFIASGDKAISAEKKPSIEALAKEVQKNAMAEISEGNILTEDEKKTLKRYARNYIDAESRTIKDLPSEDQELVRKHAKEYVAGEKEIMKVLKINEEEKQNILRAHAKAFLSDESDKIFLNKEDKEKWGLVINKDIVRKGVAGYIKATYSAIERLSDADKKNIQEYLDKAGYKKHAELAEHIRYAKAIEESVDNVKDEYSAYLKNDIYLIKMSNSANSLDTIKVFKKLAPIVDYIDDPNTLKGQRQLSEKAMYEHLEKAVGRAQSNPGLIAYPLSQVMFIRQRRFNSLKNVKEALTSNDPQKVRENLKQLLEQPFLKVHEIGEEFYGKEVKTLETQLEELIKDGLDKKYSPAEYQKRAVDLIQMTSTLAYQRLLENFKYDPEAVRDIKARRVDIMLKMSDQSSAALNTALRLRNFEQQKGLMFKMMMWEIYIMTLSMGEMRLQQFEGRIGNVFHRCMSEIFNTGL
jgi:hypothetical protein